MIHSKEEEKKKEEKARRGPRAARRRRGASRACPPGGPRPRATRTAAATPAAASPGPAAAGRAPAPAPQTDVHTPHKPRYTSTQFSGDSACGAALRRAWKSRTSNSAQARRASPLSGLFLSRTRRDTFGARERSIGRSTRFVRGSHLWVCGGARAGGVGSVGVSNQFRRQAGGSPGGGGLLTPQGPSGVTTGDRIEWKRRGAAGGRARRGTSCRSSLLCT